MIDRLATQDVPLGDRAYWLSTWRWVQERRPYYDLYPSIIPMLEHVDLAEVPVGVVRPKLPQMAIRLPKAKHSLGFTHDDKEFSLRTVFFGECEFGTRPAIQMAIDYGEMVRGKPIVLYRHWYSDGDESFERAVDRIESSIGRGVEAPKEFLLRVAKILASISLLAEDKDLIEPDVLARDRSKYKETGDSKYVERAQRRGKIAWAIGTTLETIPHYRRSHLAKFWVGPGRKIPIIQLRRGTVVKRKQVTEVPTGYLDDLLPVLN